MMYRLALVVIGMLLTPLAIADTRSRDPHPLLHAGVSFAYSISDRRVSDLQPYVFTLDRREGGYFVFRVECAGKSMACIPQTRVYDQNLIEVGRTLHSGRVALRTRFRDRFDLFPLTPNATFRVAAEVASPTQDETRVQYRISVGTPEEWSIEGASPLKVIPVSFRQHTFDEKGEARSTPLFDETRFYSPDLGFWVRSMLHEQGHGVVELSLIRQ